MRRTLLALLAALVAAGCASPCEELGHRLCQCTPSGSQRRACEDAVDRQLANASPAETDPTAAWQRETEQTRFCSAKLDTCNEPEGQSFCDWILSADAKVACGLAYE
ncbi:MAG TPA: hypothetical protein VLS93_19415 [Anaeromyxobacteraceae bacterium]|nr:hypothetical protein [Anaeromyxobacteraceae bacterium]